MDQNQIQQQDDFPFNQMLSPFVPNNLPCPSISEKQSLFNKPFSDKNVFTPTRPVNDSFQLNNSIISIFRKSNKNSPSIPNGRADVVPTKLFLPKITTNRQHKKFNRNLPPKYSQLEKSQKNVKFYSMKEKQSMNSSIRERGNKKIEKLSVKGLKKKNKIIINKEQTCCNCKNSQCLKLYCDCLRANGFCGPRCHCQNCENHALSEKRKQKIREIKLRNPYVFQPIIVEKEAHSKGVEKKVHHRGCNCKKSGCLKNYCKCRQFGVLCGISCKCKDCKNCKQHKLTISVNGFKPVSIGTIFCQFKRNA